MFLDDTTNNSKQNNTQAEIDNLKYELAFNEDEIADKLFFRKWLNIALIIVFFGFITYTPFTLIILLVPLWLWHKSYIQKRHLAKFEDQNGTIGFFWNNGYEYSDNGIAKADARSIHNKIEERIGAGDDKYGARTILVAGAHGITPVLLYFLAYGKGFTAQRGLYSYGDITSPKRNVVQKTEDGSTWIGGDPYKAISGLRLASILSPIVYIQYVLYSGLMVGFDIWGYISSLYTGQPVYSTAGMVGYAIILAMVLLLWYRTKNGSTYKLLLEIEKTLENRIAELEKSKNELVESE